MVVMGWIVRWAPAIVAGLLGCAAATGFAAGHVSDPTLLATIALVAAVVSVVVAVIWLRVAWLVGPQTSGRLVSALGGALLIGAFAGAIALVTVSITGSSPRLLADGASALGPLVLLVLGFAALGVLLLLRERLATLLLDARRGGRS